MSTAKKLDFTQYADLIPDDIQDVKLSNIDKSNMHESAESFNNIAIVSELDPKDMLELSINNGFRHIIHTGGMSFESELKTSARICNDPMKMIYYPMSSALRPDKVGPVAEDELAKYQVNFSKANEKQVILRELESTLGDLTSSSSLVGEILSNSDELLTNAIFNAPVVDQDNSHKKTMSRSAVDVTMDEGKFGYFFCGADEHRIIIGCRDPYGMLNSESLLKKIHKCYENGVSQNINMTGQGGAGIGSYMVFDTSSSYYLVVDESKITLVCSVFPRKGSCRTRQEEPKNLHFLILKEGQQDG